MMILDGISALEKETQSQTGKGHEWKVHMSRTNNHFKCVKFNHI